MQGSRTESVAAGSTQRGHPRLRQPRHERVRKHARAHFLSQTESDMVRLGQTWSDWIRHGRTRSDDFLSKSDGGHLPESDMYTESDTFDAPACAADAPVCDADMPACAADAKLAPRTCPLAPRASRLAPLTCPLAMPSRPLATRTRRFLSLG